MSTEHSIKEFCDVYEVSRQDTTNGLVVKTN